MKIDYVKLENVAGLVTGSNIDTLEIDLSKSHNKIVNIRGENGKGKALPNDTPIPTPYGWTTMGELHVGEYVFGKDGKPTKIIGVYPQEKKQQCWEMIFTDGRRIIASEDHLWNVLNIKKNKYHASPTKRIKKKDFDNFVIDNNGEVEYSKIETDISVKENVDNILSGELGQTINYAFIYGTIEERWELLEGLLHYSKEEIINGISGTPLFDTPVVKCFEQLIEVIHSLGLSCKTQKTPGDNWEIFPDGGHNMILEVHRPKHMKLRHMRKCGFEMCTCIRVDAPDSLFLCGDFIVTHNSVLISSLTPFAYQTSVDERSSLPYIVKGKQGYKEIRFKDNNDEYVAKHYYRPTKGDSHTVKSYFSKNGEELNKNGNTSSFISLVELYFGITPEMMRLIRLGTNVNSFISLSPAKRKDYIGKLIDELNVYLNIHKKLSEDVRLTRSLLNVNNQNLYNTHIEDIDKEKDKLKEIKKKIEANEKSRDKIISKLASVDSLIKNNDIHKLQKQRQESEASLAEFDKVNERVKQLNLENTNLDKLMNKRNDISNDKVDIKSKIQSYKLSIDNLYVTIDRLDRSIKKITSGNDLKSLQAIINDLKNYINKVPIVIRQFTPYDVSTNEVMSIISKLNSFNKLGTMIYSLGNKPLKIYLKLINDNIDIEKWIKKQAKKIQSRVNKNDLQLLIDNVFEDDDVIEPNCSTAFKQCPYYRLSEAIYSLREEYDDVLDSETLQYVKVIYQNMLNIFIDVSRIRSMKLPTKVLENLTDDKILERLQLKEILFDTTTLDSYLSLYSEWNVYQDKLHQLKNYEHQLVIYKESGINVQEEQITEARDSVKFYEENITTLQKRLVSVDDNIDTIDKQIALVSKYAENKKYYKIVKRTLADVTKILLPLETAQDEKRELEYELRLIDNDISRYRSDYRSLENKLLEYKRLVKEGKKLNKQFTDMNVIMNAVSTKKGIPVIYMSEYLKKIQMMSNQLLELIYDGDLMLSNFNVTQDAFEIPYIKNNTIINDVKYSSQSELSLITMALSFALSYKASGNYNILLLDEIDAGLDENNRYAFLKMLNRQIELLDAEQVFIISHNIGQMANVPMDVIQLSEMDTNKLQNVIYSI